MYARQTQGERIPRTHSSASDLRGRLAAQLVVAVAVLSLCAMLGATSAFGLEYTFPPKVLGNAHPHLGETLECRNGDWKNASPEFSYQWVVEGDELGFKSTKQSVLAGSLKLTKEYENKQIWCDVEATYRGETVIAESENSICFESCVKTAPPEPPVAVTAPVVSGGSSGKASVGETLSCSQGTWKGTLPLTYTYKWFHDGKEAISGATSSQYKVVSEDETHKLSCRVTAANSGGEATQESSNSLLVPGTAPVNSEAPSVLGMDAVNETLTCDPGRWSGSPPITYEYRWFRNGAEVAMETGPTFIVQPNDEGQKLRCKVIAVNNLGKAEASSAEVKIAGTLKNTAPPVVTPESAKLGTVLKCSEGAWNESASELKFRYEWLREDEPIAGATTHEYKVASADVKHLLYCRVFATNAGKEEAQGLSQAIPVPGSSPPVNESLPEVQGTPALLGHTLTCSDGTWTNGPESYVFQWMREQTPITSATSQSYEVKPADEGHWVTCRVIAINTEGPSEPAESVLANVPGEAPTPIRAPEIEGGTPTPHVGESLTCLHGEWKGAPTPTFTYAWYREGSEKLASTIAYTIAAADRGHTLSCVVTASNSEAPSGVMDASAGLLIPGSAPEAPLAGPQIEGIAAVEQQLTCKAGTWTGEPAPTFTYQWLSDGTEIPSARGERFTIGTAYRGYNISCRVTGTNREAPNGVSALSKSVHVPGEGPDDIEQPFVTGGTSVGAPLTCERGHWQGKPPPSFTYQWYRGGTPISGATEETHVVETADVGQTLSCNVLGVNSEGSLEQESTNAVTIPRVATGTLPVVAGAGSGNTIEATLPNSAEILATIRRQVGAALSESHLKRITKTGSFSFGFTAPGAGTFEVEWFQLVRGARGAKSKERVLAQARALFARVSTKTVRVKLNASGRSLLKGKKTVKLSVKAVFTLSGHRPVVWTETVVLHS